MTKESIDILIENLSVLDYIKVTKEITELQQENMKLQKTVNNCKERIDKAIDYIDITIELIKQQPTEDDSWILDRLNGFKIILKGDSDE